MQLVLGIQQGVAWSDQPSGVHASNAARVQQGDERSSQPEVVHAELAADSEQQISEHNEHSHQEQARSSTAALAQCYDLAPPAESFCIGSDDSDCTDVEAEIADDEFWWSELHSADASERAGGSGWPTQPPEEDARPAKRHRPG